MYKIALDAFALLRTKGPKEFLRRVGSGTAWRRLVFGGLQIRDWKPALAREFLHGNGLEIGALHNPLPLTDAARVRYVDRFDIAGLRRHYPELGDLELVPVDIIDDGETLANVLPASQDFIAASHFFEHCENPLGAIRAHLGRLKPGGLLFYAIPDKRMTFDHARANTGFAHLVADDIEGPQCSRRPRPRPRACLSSPRPASGRAGSCAMDRPAFLFRQTTPQAWLRPSPALQPTRSFAAKLAHEGWRGCAGELRPASRGAALREPRCSKRSAERPASTRRSPCGQRDDVATRREGGNGVAQQRLGLVPVALGNGGFELAQPALNRSRIAGRRAGGHDAGNPGVGDGFLVLEQDLVDTLTRPHAGKDDGDVLVGREARDLDHLAGEVENAHLLAHFQHIDRGPLHPDVRGIGVRGRREDELRGLAHRHEIAHHVRMGDRDGAATRDLFLELRNRPSRWSRARCQSAPTQAASGRHSAAWVFDTCV